MFLSGKQVATRCNDPQLTDFVEGEFLYEQVNPFFFLNLLMVPSIIRDTHISFVQHHWIIYKTVSIMFLPYKFTD